MRGAVLEAPFDIRFEQRQDPRIVEPTDAIIRLSATCVCGSDLWPYRGLEPVAGPAPMGHEYVGIVEDIGADVRNVRPGQFVIGSFFASDNTCENCRAGYQTACIHREPVGAIGTQAEHARIPLADGTLVATPRSHPTTSSRACSPRPTCSAPAGSAQSPPRSAPARPSWSSATAPSACSA
jgi:threonine dehydrogenase-like Zn-dependent dehydrogenase